MSIEIKGIKIELTQWIILDIEYRILIHRYLNKI